VNLRSDANAFSAQFLCGRRQAQGAMPTALANGR
jgi:hypothetical protein